jgi:hypothetical protein
MATPIISFPELSALAGCQRQGGRDQPSTGQSGWMIRIQFFGEFLQAAEGFWNQYSEVFDLKPTNGP